MAPQVRYVSTSSDATAVQFVHFNRRGLRDIEHIGSAHTPAGVELLKGVARGWLAAGQGGLDLHVARLQEVATSWRCLRARCRLVRRG